MRTFISSAVSIRTRIIKFIETQECRIEAPPADYVAYLKAAAPSLNERPYWSVRAGETVHAGQQIGFLRDAPPDGHFGSILSPYFGAVVAVDENAVTLRCYASELERARPTAAYADIERRCRLVYDKQISRAAPWLFLILAAPAVLAARYFFSVSVPGWLMIGSVTATVFAFVMFKRFSTPYVNYPKDLERVDKVAAKNAAGKECRNCGHKLSGGYCTKCGELFSG